MRFLFLGCALLMVSAGVAQEPAKKRSLFVIDKDGKEVEVQTWKFLVGTKPLIWDAPKLPLPLEIAGKKIDLAKLIQAPEYLELR